MATTTSRPVVSIPANSINSTCITYSTSSPSSGSKTSLANSTGRTSSTNPESSHSQASTNTNNITANKTAATVAAGMYYMLLLMFNTCVTCSP